MNARHIFLTIALLITTMTLQAQINGWEGNGLQQSPEKCNKHLNLNGSVWMGYTTTKYIRGKYFRNNPTIVYGANLSYTLWHRLNLGLSIARFSNKISSYWEMSEFSDWRRYLNGYYGGIFIEPVLFPKYPVHVSFPMIIGGGNATEHMNYLQSHWPTTYEIEEGHKKANRGFLIFEPGIEAEFNLLKYFKLGAGVKYSFTSDTKTGLGYYSDYSLWAPTYHLSLKFGVF